MSSQKVLIPEVLEPDSALPRDLVTLRKFAHLLDAAIPIPGTNRGVGLDPIIGLVPGVGDAVGAILSTWIVIGAFRHRVPFPKIMRMMFNILVDLYVGTIPIIGDAIDFLFPENQRNVELLIRYRDRRTPPRSFGTMALVIGAAFLGIFFAGLLAIAFAIWMLYLLLRDFPMF